MKKKLILTITILAAALTAGGCSLFGGTDAPQRKLSEVSLPTTEELVLRYDGYGFQALQTRAEQRLYAGVDDAVKKVTAEPFVTEKLEDISRAADVVEFYKDDHPEVFWIDDTHPYYYSEEGELLTIQLNYKFSGEQLTQAKEALEQQIAAAVAGAPQDGAAYERELYAHDHLIDLCTYDDEAAQLHKEDKVRANEQTVYGVFVEKKAVCEGYARAFQLLCSRLDVPCWVIQGTVQREESTETVNHIWNCAMLDNDWYQVDITWDDEDKEQDFRYGQYLYFNLTTEMMTADHVISPHYKDYTDSEIWYNGFVPYCDSTKYYYFEQNAMKLTDLDSSDNAAYLASVAANGAKDCVYTVDEALDFKDTYDKIVNGHAYEWITQANEINGYDPALNPECALTSNNTRRLVVLLLEKEQ